MRRASLWENGRFVLEHARLHHRDETASAKPDRGCRERTSGSQPHNDRRSRTRHGTWGSYLTPEVVPSGARSKRMEENGARLNRSRLVSAYLLAASLAARPGPGTQARSQIGRRADAVQEAVTRVLAAAGRPLRACEIHSAAQDMTGTALSWNTVKDCLHRNARRLDSPVERVGHGRYRHR